jgi:ferredoxin
LDGRLVLAGDVAYGAASVVEAIASGQRAARTVYEAVHGVPFLEEVRESHAVLRGPCFEGFAEAEFAQHANPLPHGQQVEPLLDSPEAHRQSARCFDCTVSPVVDSARCVLCGTCVEVCSTRCIRLVRWDRVIGIPARHCAAVLEFAGSTRSGGRSHNSDATALLKDEELCIRCGRCARHCPAAAITMERHSLDVMRSC